MCWPWLTSGRNFSWIFFFIFSKLSLAAGIALYSNSWENIGTGMVTSTSTKKKSKGPWKTCSMILCLTSRGERISQLEQCDKRLRRLKTGFHRIQSPWWGGYLIPSNAYNLLIQILPHFRAQLLAAKHANQPQRGIGEQGLKERLREEVSRYILHSFIQCTVLWSRIQEECGRAEVKVTENPCVWWQANREKFPLLSLFWGAHSSFPATSAGAERTFNLDGLILTPFRFSCALITMNIHPWAHILARSLFWQVILLFIGSH